jgi:hypothetical protein
MIIFLFLSFFISLDNVDPIIIDQDFQLELKMATEDTLDIRCFFLLEIDTSREEIEITSVKVEGYKVFRKNVLLCQELNQIEKKKCNAEIRSYINNIIEVIKMRPELIEDHVIKQEGLRISKFYRVRIIPN